MPTPRLPVPEGPYDLAIIGGGINGAALCRDAVLRGHSVCLLEKGDWGEGTSSRSSKMLHGGMRYLEQLHFGLVFEALQERGRALAQAPHLTRPQAFVIPIYNGLGGWRRSRWAVRAGVLLYDLLALGRRLGRGRMLGREEVLARVPGLRPSGLMGGGLYFDGVMDDARFCLSQLLDARAAAAPSQCAALSRAEVLAVRRSAPLEISARDRVGGSVFRILAHRVLRAIGPWSDSDGLGFPSGDGPLLWASKGVHLVLPPLPAGAFGPHGLLLTHSRDGRVFFVLPWLGRTLVGTTETPWEGRPEELRVEPAELTYLLEELQRLFPNRRFAPSEVCAAFAGVRPLARARQRLGRGHGKASRHHRLVDHGDGLFSLIGGKYTTCRSIARHVLDRVIPGRPCGTARRPLPGGEDGPWARYAAGRGREWIARHGAAQVERLFHRYGTRLERVLALVESDAALGTPLAPEHPELRAEVVYAAREEDLLYPADFICRRSDLRFQRGNGRAAYDAIEALLRAQAGAERLPADLPAARAAFFAELEAEDRLRQGAKP